MRKKNKKWRYKSRVEPIVEKVIILKARIYHYII